MPRKGGPGNPEIDDPEDVVNKIGKLTDESRPVLGTQEIADAFGISRQGILNHLDELEGSRIQSRMIGRTKVWWVEEHTENWEEPIPSEPAPTPAVPPGAPADEGDTPEGVVQVRGDGGGPEYVHEYEYLQGQLNQLWDNIFDQRDRLSTATKAIIRLLIGFAMLSTGAVVDSMGGVEIAGNTYGGQALIGLGGLVLLWGSYHGLRSLFSFDRYGETLPRPSHYDDQPEREDNPRLPYNYDPRNDPDPTYRGLLVPKQIFSVEFNPLLVVILAPLGLLMVFVGDLIWTALFGGGALTYSILFWIVRGQPGQVLPGRLKQIVDLLDPHPFPAVRGRVALLFLSELAVGIALLFTAGPGPATEVLTGPVAFSPARVQLAAAGAILAHVWLWFMLRVNDNRMEEEIIGTTDGGGE